MRKNLRTYEHFVELDEKRKQKNGREVHLRSLEWLRRQSMLRAYKDLLAQHDSLPERMRKEDRRDPFLRELLRIRTGKDDWLLDVSARPRAIVWPYLRTEMRTWLGVQIYHNVAMDSAKPCLW